MKIGLALGGGAARGFAHIGVIKALEREGIQIDVVAGTSAGSLVGALYASGLNGAQLQALGQSMDEAEIADWTLSLRGVIKGEALENYVNKTLGNRLLQNMRRPFIAVATDYYSGEAVYFQRGNTGQAVRASSSIPGIFAAVQIDDKKYVDGGLVSPVPAFAAKKLGADFVIAIDISARPNIGASDSLAASLNQTIAIMGQGLRREELAKHADFVFHPPIDGVSSGDFTARNSLIVISERALLAKITELKEKINAAKQRLNLR